MSSPQIDDKTLALAEELVRGRVGVRPVADSTRKRYASASVEKIASDIKAAADFRQRDALGILLVERQLGTAKSSRARSDLDGVLFRLAQHYRTIAGSRESEQSARACAAEAAEVLFRSLQQPPDRFIKELQEERRFIKDARPTWRATTGLDRERCHAIVEQLGRALRPERLDTRQSADHYLHLASRKDRPSWVALGKADRADALLTHQSPWSAAGSGPGVDASDLDLAHAVVLALSEEAYHVAAELAEVLGRRMGRSWGPSRALEQQLTWDALRAARHLGAMASATGSDRRLNALSAYELLAGSKVAHGVRETARSCALDGLEPVAGANGHEWASVVARLIASGDHEALLDELDNADRANLREQLGYASNTHDLVLHVESIRRELRSEIRSSYPDRTLDRSRRRHARWRELFLPSESAVIEAVDVALADHSRAKRLEEVSERTAALLAARPSLESLVELVVASGSAMVQEVALPTLHLLLKETEDAERQAQRSSRPRLVVSLQTDRLPLHSDVSTTFAAVLEVENSGNTSALNAVLDVTSRGAELPTQLQAVARLRPGDVLPQPIELTNPANLDQLEITVEASWADELGQSFSDSWVLVAEAETASRWTSSDVNPYRLEPVRRLERLFGRNDEVASLHARLASGESLFVTGKKRVGKSSLVAVTLDSLTDVGRATQRVPFGYLQAESVGQIIENLLITISDLLAEGYGEAVPDLPKFDERRAANTAGRWLHHVARGLPDEAGIVLAIDDFDELPNQFWDSEEGSTLFIFLRALVEEPWLSVVFIGSEVMPSLMQRHGYKLNQVGRFDLSALGRPQGTAELLRSPSQDRLEWDDESVRSIHLIGAGNPYYSTLLARELWDRMRSRDRSYVSRTDVHDCIGHLAKSAIPDHFVHLWADGAAGIDTASEIATQNAAILFAIAQCAAGGESAERDEVLSYASLRSGPDTRPQLSERLENLIARHVVVEAGPHAITHEIPLVQMWFRESAASLLGAQLRSLADTASEVAYISDRRLLELARGFEFDGKQVSEIRLRDWLDQFADPGARLAAFRMLERIRSQFYLDQDALQESGGKLRSWIPRPEALNHALPPKGYTADVWLVAALNADLAVLKAIATGARIPQKAVLSLDDAIRRAASGDILGTAVVATSFDGTLSEVSAALSELHQASHGNGLRLGAFSVASLDDSTSLAIPDGEVPRFVDRHLTSSARPFDPADGCIGKGPEAIRLREHFLQIGQRLSADHPLGWPTNGLLLLFESQVPRYMPSVFWAAGVFGGREWQPLFDGSQDWGGAVPRAIDEETDLVRRLAAGGESETCEYKASFRTDWPSGGLNRDREFDVVKAVAGLMNGQGGSLLIGVTDSGQAVGLTADYESSRSIVDSDGFERHLRTQLSNRLPGLMPADIQVRFVTIDSHEVCHVRCKPASNPLWLKKGDVEELYVRDGPQAPPKKGRQLSDYLATRFSPADSA